MKSLYRTAFSICVAMLPATFATSCTKHYTGIPVAQLRLMTPFQAKVEKVTVEDFSKLDVATGMIAIVWLKTDDGKRVSIGGTKATPEMIAFAQSLKAGQRYMFPQALLDYEKTSGQKLQ